MFEVFSDMKKGNYNRNIVAKTMPKGYGKVTGPLSLNGINCLMFKLHSCFSNTSYRNPIELP